jgi:hypothetical protein
VAALIRLGRLCRHCTDKECKDSGTDAEPIEVECPGCNGEGCDQCAHGEFRIVGCPNAFCKDMGPVVELCDLFEEGLPPIAGGSLDQSAWFIEAARRLKNEEARIRKEANAN